MPAKAPSLLQDLRSLPGAFRVLFVGTLVNRFGTFVYPFLTIYLSRRGMSPGDIGLVLTGFGVGILAASLAGGWFADRFGRRNAIVLGTLGQAAAIAALYFAKEPLALTVLTTFSGFCGGFYGPAASALVVDVVPAERRLTAFAALRLAGNAGFAFGTAAGGILVTLSPFWLFAGDALTTIAFGLLAFFALPKGGHRSSDEARWSEAIAKLRRDRGFLTLALAQAVTAFIFAQFASTLALETMHRAPAFAFHGWTFSTEQIYGLLVGFNGVLITLMELPLTRVTGKLRPRRVMAVGYLLLGAGFAMNALPGCFALLAVGITIFTLGEMLVMPMVGPWIARLAPDHMRGRYMGALGASWTVGGIAGQIVGLPLHAAHPAALWLLCGALGVAAAMAISLSGRRRVAARARAPIPAE